MTKVIIVLLLFCVSCTNAGEREVLVRKVNNGSVKVVTADTLYHIGDTVEYDGNTCIIVR